MKVYELNERAAVYKKIISDALTTLSVFQLEKTSGVFRRISTRETRKLQKNLKAK
jgi:hypothetical protein